MANNDAASALAFAQALGQLQKARMADAEAAKFAAQTGATLAQAKTAMSAADKLAADAARSAATAQRQAAQEAVRAAAEQQKAADALARAAQQAAKAQERAAQQASREAAKAAKQEADESARAWSQRRKQFEEQEKFRQKLIKQEKEAAEEAKRVATKTAQAQKDAAQEWQDSGRLMTSPIEMVKKALGSLGPQGQAAAMALAIATAGVTAFVGAIVGGMTTAIGVVEKMTQRLSVFSALGGSAAAGKATLDMVNRLGERLPFATDQLAQWANAMQRAGQSGNGLENAVKAMAAAAALNPEGGAEAVEQAIGKLSGDGKGAASFLKQIQQEAGRGEKSLRAMGLNMADLGGKAAVAKMTAKQLQEAIERALVKKGAGPLDALNNTFPAILAKVKEGFSSLFEGVKIEPFMASVRSLFGMFNRSSPTMAALRGVIVSVFGTLFSWASKAADVVHSAFQQIVIAALKVRIGINPILVSLRQLRDEVVRAVAATGLFQGKSTALASVLGFVGQAIKGAFTFAVYSVVFFIGALVGMARMATIVITKVRSVFAGFSLPNLAAAAGNMITSFVTGITSKIGSVIKAMMGMGQAAKKALFGALGIASPSKVALEAAGNVTSTFSDKVDDDKGKTQAAFTGMVKVPTVAGGSKSRGGGVGSEALALLGRLCDILEASPGVRDIVAEALAEAAQENA